MRKVAAMFWCAQVDAADKDEAEVDAAVELRGWLREEDEEGTEGEKK